MLDAIFLLSCLRHCAFTANPKEITVKNFSRTSDNGDHSSRMAAAPSDATIVNQIEFAFSRVTQLQTKDIQSAEDEVSVGHTPLLPVLRGRREYEKLSFDGRW